MKLALEIEGNVVVREQTALVLFVFSVHNGNLVLESVTGFWRILSSFRNIPFIFVQY